MTGLGNIKGGSSQKTTKPSLQHITWGCTTETDMAKNAF